MPYFKRAQQLGATLAMIGCDRGLAYDLLGKQAVAQADYRAALAARDGDEARRRLALSLAISGDKAGAFATLAPLLARGDAAGAPGPRLRACADRRCERGDARSMRRCPAARPASRPSFSASGRFRRAKAAAVNLGIFPDAAMLGYAYAAATSRHHDRA